MLICKTTCFLGFTFSFFLFNSCKKEKEDLALSSINDTENTASSSLRIVNLGEYRHVIANGDTLTSMLDGQTTSYFAKGHLEDIWSVPQQLIQEAKILTIGLTGMNEPAGYSDAREEEVNFDVDASQKNKDYYTLLPYGSGQPWVVPIDRDMTAPSDDTKFKIRVINLCKYLPGLPVNAPSPNGPVENLVGEISLAYADGTLVSPKTSNISLSQRESEYIELPYGTYQFKVLTADGRQVPGGVYGVNRNIIRFNTFDPASSRINVYEDPAATGVTYAPVKTYHPGGIYTIVVAPQFFGYYVAAKNLSIAVQNQFKIIEDHETLPVHGYGKIQVVNAYSEEGLTFKVNGEVFATNVPYGSASDYRIVKEGSYQVEVSDRSKASLANVVYDLSTMQNQSIWLYRDREGKAQLKVLANDMSGEFYYERFPNDGTYNRYEHTMVFATRFVNFCPDIPYASFTIDDGQDMRRYAQLFANNQYEMHRDEAMYNMKFAEPSVHLPYVRWRLDYDVFYKIMTYRSSEGVKLGEWAHDIPPLLSQGFIANTNLYSNVGRRLPAAEPGVYTVALIGGSHGNSETMKAKLITIKHNK